MTTRTRKAKQPPYEMFRVLTPPDVCHYVYGRLTHSYEPMLRNTPIVVFGGQIVAILSERCIIETANERTVVYSPSRGDVSWYRRHPADGCPWATDDVG